MMLTFYVSKHSEIRSQNLIELIKSENDNSVNVNVET